jgi:lipase chaperone LimK
MRKSITWWSTAAAVLVAGAVVVVLVALFARQDRAPATTALKEPELFPFVRSFAGTQPDGRFEAAGPVDSIATATTLRFFDYYLDAIGEKGLPDIRAEIEREIDRQLAHETRAAAKDLLRRYLLYKLALADIEKATEPGKTSLEAIRARFAGMRDARRQFFSETEIQAMFQESDAYDEDAIARLEINEDASLDQAQKAARLAALDAAMPAALKEAREAPYQVARLEDEVQKMRTQGASDQEIYRKRALAFSPEAAARLAHVDREEHEWKLRIQAYLTERSRLGYSDPTVLQQLRERLFTADEQRRLAAFEPS